MRADALDADAVSYALCAVDGGAEVKSDLVDIAGKIQGETEKAYRFHDGARTVWLAKSQCEWDATEKTMAMPEWLAKEKELI